ncbi:MAG: ABCB family ABC transporter ATP-binding protein/permease [Alphaproteobacteria bacterium]
MASDAAQKRPGWRWLARTVVPALWPTDAPGLKTRVAVAFALVIGAKLVAVQIPFFYKAVVDGLETGANQVATLPVLMLLAYGGARLTSALFNNLREAVFARVAQRAGRRLSLRVFRHLFELPLQFHLERRTGELSRAISRGVQAMTFLLGMVLFNLAPTAFEFVLVIGLLLWNYHWSFALITALTIGGYAVFTVFATEWRTAFRREMNARDNDVAGRSVDGLVNYETVKLFTNETYEAERLDRALASYEDAAVRSQTSLAALNFGQQAIVALGVTALMFNAARGVVAGTMTVGDVVLVNAFILQLYQPLNILGFVYREVKQSLADLEHLSGLLDVAPAVADAPDARPLRQGPGHVRFEQVRFGYDARRPILDGLELEVPAGRTLAIVGGTGAGKSTLVRLLCRFYDVEAGRILIDGQDVRAVTQASLRRAIGVVPQDTVLFNDTIAANIAYGRPGASPPEIARAAETAQIRSFIEGLPDGWATLVGERGLKLSGGEKQRVAIARMVLKDPRILVLDEATSALDTVTERALQTAIRKITRGRTSLVIAHRLSTILDADRIVVMEAGRVVESGSHAQLLAQGGRYARLWQDQQADAAAS